MRIFNSCFEQLFGSSVAIFIYILGMHFRLVKLCNLRNFVVKMRIFNGYCGQLFESPFNVFVFVLSMHFCLEKPCNIWNFVVKIFNSCFDQLFWSFIAVFVYILDMHFCLEKQCNQGNIVEKTRMINMFGIAIWVVFCSISKHTHHALLPGKAMRCGKFYCKNEGI